MILDLQKILIYKLLYINNDIKTLIYHHSLFNILI